MGLMCFEGVGQKQPDVDTRVSRGVGFISKLPTHVLRYFIVLSSCFITHQYLCVCVCDDFTGKSIGKESICTTIGCDRFALACYSGDAQV